MKIDSSFTRREDAMAVIIMLAILSILCVCIAMNTHSLNQLHSEIKTLEQRQKARLTQAGAAGSSSSNSPAIPSPLSSSSSESP